MPPKIYLRGRRFGKLAVTSEDGRDKHGAVMWLCDCDCGNTSRVRGSQLINGAVKSCGCGVGEDAARRETTHGQSRTPLYSRWRAMRGRCENPNDSAFRHYGGRGIVVCERWRSFENFRADMGDSFHPELELDRRDVNGNYEPSNCLWVSRNEQQRNRRNNHRLTYDGVERSLVEWEEVTGIKSNTILTRIRRGWEVKRALGF